MSCGQAADTTHHEHDLLRLETKIALPGVDGRIDHLAYDSAGHRVFLAALGNNTVEVVDLASRARVHTITGLWEPQGVCYIAVTGRLAVANGGNGDCIVYDGKSYAEIGRIALGDDADNVRYDGGRLFVGYGSGGIAVIDPGTLRKTDDIQLHGHPESFQEDSGLLYINVPDEKVIRVVAMDDAVKSDDGWTDSGASANFPMAIDSPHSHLFVAYRHPAQLRMLDGHTGAVLASSPCVGDADDVFYDATTGLVFISGGEGYLDIFRGGRLVNHISTRKGARTSLWVPEEHKLILAVPARGREEAALWIYGLQP